jgi:hypothetical protein
MKRTRYRDVETGRPLLSCHDIGHSLYHADDAFMHSVSRFVPRMRPFLMTSRKSSGLRCVPSESQRW